MVCPLPVPCRKTIAVVTAVIEKSPFGGGGGGGFADDPPPQALKNKQEAKTTMA